MRKEKKKNILDKIDDSINDKIDEIKEQKNKKRNAEARKENKNINIKNSDKDKRKDKNKGKDKNITKDKDISNDKDITNDKNEKHKFKFKFRNKDKPNKEKKKKRAFWKRLLTFILILGIIGVLSVTAFIGYVVITAPEFDESALVVKDQTVVYDVSGNIITTLGVEKRESVSYDELPQVLIDAIIATEDSRFFQHNGVDLLRFIKATFLQLIGRDDAGGASTLTMQTVKNNITKQDKTESTQTIKQKIQKVIRKFQDVYIAVFKVEKEYSKEEILEIYVNDNYLGGSYWGVEEASKYYFGKSVSDLTLPEASLIAGLFQLPGYNNPYNNLEGATKRRTLVLKYMLNHGYITKEEKELAEKVSIESLLVGANSNSNVYQGYVDAVVSEVEELTGDNPYKVPMKIYTTMERSIQDGINASLNNDESYWKDEKTTAGIAVVNSETGGISALGAGRNKTGERVFNNATQAKKQPGSTAKPIFDYGPAIEFNNYSTYTQIVDEPWTYTNGPSVNNWDGGFRGLNTLSYHLMQSRNVPALKTFQQVGPKNSQKFASSLGLDVALNSSSENYRLIDESIGLDNAINEAYAIGGVAEGFTPLEMANAYACFSNGGYFIKAHTVNKIEYRDTGEEKEFKYTKERVMKDSTAYLINKILESAVSGGGFDGGSAVSGSHVAAKTGTTNFDEATMKRNNLPSAAVNDLWTIAYTSNYAVSVWYGYEKLSDGYNVSYGSYKERLVRSVMKAIPKDTRGWQQPSSVVAVQVENETWPAALPSKYTPDNMKITGYFVRGTQPTEVSERYSQLNDVKVTGTTNNGNKATITWEYTTPKVLTKSYIESYFNKSAFGNSGSKLAESRINYNNSTLGEVGFAIYKQEADGTLTLLDFTKDNKYTYTGYGNTTLVIKAEHSKFKSNASNGQKVELKLEEMVSENLVAVLSGSSTTTLKAKTYKEYGFKSIFYGKVDVTKTATIKYQVTGENILEDFTTTDEVETYINTLDPGTYKITYIISYLDKEITKARTVILT